MRSRSLDRASRSLVPDRETSRPASAAQASRSDNLLGAEKILAAVDAVPTASTSAGSTTQAVSAPDPVASTGVQNPPRLPSASIAAAGSVSSCPPSAQLQASGGVHAEAPQPSSASQSGASASKDVAAAVLKDCMVAISLYPKGLPASQVQMHAAASAALYGALVKVRRLYYAETRQRQFSEQTIKVMMQNSASALSLLLYLVRR